MIDSMSLNGNIHMRRAFADDAEEIATLSAIYFAEKDPFKRNTPQCNPLVVEGYERQLSLPYIHAFVAETTCFETANPVYYNKCKQLAGFCSLSFNVFKKREVIFGGYTPVNSPYRMDLVLPAFVIKQAIELDAQRVQLSYSFSREEKEFMQNKAGFRPYSTNIAKFILWNNDFEDSLEKLSQEAKLTF